MLCLGVRAGCGAGVGWGGVDVFRQSGGNGGSLNFLPLEFSISDIKVQILS